MSDIVTRLLLKTNDFDANLERSKKNVRGFQDNITSMSNIAASGVMKFAGAIGAVVTISEGFNRIMNSSQTLGDEYARTMQGLKEGVDQFFYSIGSGDWTPFMNGLAETISLARDAYNAIDQLGNTKMSFSYFDAKNQATAQEQIAILKDKNSTEEQKKAARELLDKTLKDQEEIVSQYKIRSQNAIQAMVRAAIGFDGVDVSAIDVDRVLRLDVSTTGDAQKEKLAKQYEDFEKEYNRLKIQYTTMETRGFGKNVHTVPVTDTNALKEAITPLLAKYQDAIQYNAILVKKSDEWLENLIGVSTAAHSAERNLSSMRKAANRASQSETNTPTPKKGSIAWYDSEISKLNKKLLAETDEQVKSTIRTTINELEEKKIKLQLLTGGDSIESIDIRLSHWNKKLIAETNAQARAAIQATINQLEQKKINLKFVIDKEAFKIAHGEMKDGVLPVPIKPVFDKVSTHGKEGKNFKLPKFKSPIQQKDIDINEQYTESLSAVASIMGNLSGAFDENSASVLQWGLNLISTVAQAIPAITGMIGVKQADTVATQAETGAEVVNAGAKALSAHAGIPFVGIALGIAAVASIIATMASIPKYATGGIVPGTSFTGDKVPALLNSGEMILNASQQSSLFKMINSGSYGALSQKIAPSGNQDIRLYSDVDIKGDRIFLALHNHIKKTGKRLW